MKQLFMFVVCVLIVGVLFTSCTRSTDTRTAQNSSAIANPASEFCVAHGYKNIIRTQADGSQIGYCILPDKECEEWAYYRGECK